MSAKLARRFSFVSRCQPECSGQIDILIYPNVMTDARELGTRPRCFEVGRLMILSYQRSPQSIERVAVLRQCYRVEVGQRQAHTLLGRFQRPVELQFPNRIFQHYERDKGRSLRRAHGYNAETRLSRDLHRSVLFSIRAI